MTLPSERPIPLELPLSKKQQKEEEEYVSPPRNAKPRRTIAKKPQKPKPTKGLRNLSNLVVEKVEQKGTTTYNQVSEELVEELKASGAAGDGKVKKYIYLFVIIF